MSGNSRSPTKLTEFGYLNPEDKPQTVGHFISRLFKGWGNNREGSSSNSAQNVQISTSNDACSQDLPSWVDVTENTTNSEEQVPYNVDINEGRSLPNVLKRISNLLALKSNNLQEYGDTELKQYWMPDSVSKQCYECLEKFTTFRRRHHCRVCGQIFCSNCCNQQIPGKIFGCIGDLRVCTYCCKIVLSYLSSDIHKDLTRDLRSLQETLRLKLSPLEEPIVSELQRNDSFESWSKFEGYQEEMFVDGGTKTTTLLSSEEKARAFQNSTSLRNLYEEIIRGIRLNTHRFRAKTYTNCFLGSELVEWLIYQQKANNRIQAIAICQALFEGNYIESCTTECCAFVDGDSLYEPGNVLLQSPEVLNFQQYEMDEPSWVQQILQDSSNSDNDTPQSYVRTSSSYSLDLNLECSSVYLSRPINSSAKKEVSTNVGSYETPKVRTSEQREFVPESGWFNASGLREENGEKSAYEILTKTYENHENCLVNQMLNSAGVGLKWSGIVRKIAKELVEVIRPDKSHNARNLDVRAYVQIKKIPGYNNGESRVLNAVSCTKNVSHKDMPCVLEAPKVLLLQGAIVYHRTEGRFMSLEPVLMQEHEYLRNLCARIVALNPDIVMVQKHVSRLAQDFLREKGITLVLNVKESTLERLSNCLQADLVGNLDAHIGRPRLGVCKKFYTKKFNMKTLMFFEGFQQKHLGATVLLTNGTKNELRKVKRIISFILFANYNWRLELSFLMDEFAQPPEFEVVESESESNASIESGCGNQAFPCGLKKTPRKRIDDFSDPLHSKTALNSTLNKLQVLNLPFSNKFRKALDGTILCTSPYVIFPVPYLETEVGKKCALRAFFPEELYESEEFEQKVKKTTIAEPDVEAPPQIRPPHPFTRLKLTGSVENSVEIQNELANFRACGGKYEKKTSVLKPTLKEVDYEENDKDVFNILNHQRLAVFFCSFSAESQNAPAFCMNPGVVYMDFYGKNDIPLGCFLEKYCFRSSYTCPSNSCNISMVKHVRRFVHNLGCVSISLNSFEGNFSEENIVMWSWCSKCQTVSPVVPMSIDTWSYSFAKYLELKFYAGKYTRRGVSPCEHSLHHDHFQYFGYKNDVASFRYTPINVWEITLPPPSIEIKINLELLHLEVIDEIKELAEKSYELFSVISERISHLDNAALMSDELSKDKAKFKQQIEEVQLILSSKNTPSVLQLKKSLSELVEEWNCKLKGSDVENIEDEDGQKGVKNLLSQLLPNTSSPKGLSAFPVQEHYNLPEGTYGFISVSENDLSSIIAYALNSPEVQREKTTLNTFLRDNSNPGLSTGPSGGEDVASSNVDFDDNTKLHIDVVFEDSICNFLCRIYYAEKFENLRKLMMESEEMYVRSLSKSVPWNARGGKSGSAFIKTSDERFILKEASKNEVQLFLENACNYFAYIQKVYRVKQPTLLGKICGIYQIIFKNNLNGQQLRKNLLVMENLFYNRNVSRKFDLKGSIRNRLTVPEKEDEDDVVLLDENLLKMNTESPLYILPHSKAVLSAAIENDTEFLASQFVMDYSLLVGLDNEKKELVLGIIDYIRTFTWDKKLETIVKKSGILGGQGKTPTIISPIEYQKRFIEAMHRYFLEVPDHWEGLGKDLEC